MGGPNYVLTTPAHERGNFRHLFLPVVENRCSCVHVAVVIVGVAVAVAVVVVVVVGVAVRVSCFVSEAQGNVTIS